MIQTASTSNTAPLLAPGNFAGKRATGSFHRFHAMVASCQHEDLAHRHTKVPTSCEIIRVKRLRASASMTGLLQQTFFFFSGFPCSNYPSVQLRFPCLETFFAVHQCSVCSPCRVQISCQFRTRRRRTTITNTGATQTSSGSTASSQDLI